MSRRRIMRALALVVFAATAVSCADEAASDAPLRAPDADLVEARTELESERQRADELETEVAELRARLQAVTSTTVPPVSVPEVTVTVDPADDVEPPPPGPDTQFRALVAASPSEIVSSSCAEGDVDCLVEEAIAICEGLVDSDASTLARFSMYSRGYETDRPLLVAAIDGFCPLGFLPLLFPPVILKDGVFLVVDGAADPPSEIPEGTYSSTINRGTTCFWQRTDAAGAVVADATVAPETRAVTLSVPVTAGETFVTFGCRNWTFAE